MAREDFHGFRDGVRWRLVPDGVEVEGSGVERTRGTPATVTRVWNAYHEQINRVARERRVPAALIVATICTESAGRADAVREEPGYVSDERTPHKVSAGLMQTLLSTARESLQMSFGREWLLDPGHSIDAGAAYIAKQAKVTSLDPPLVAAAYNAGGLHYQPGAENRWKLRQYPIGTGAHVDRFVRFFNDAVAVLAQHSVRPAVAADAPASGPASGPRGGATRGSGDAAVQIAFAEHARPGDLTPYSHAVLTDILCAARLRRALISSTARSPEDQARVMYDNLERVGVDAQRRLYKRPGNRVIDKYERAKAAGKSPDDIKAAMAETIREVGPTNVSRHASDPRVLNVFDVAPSSIADRRAFERAVAADRRVTAFLTPPTDPGYHLEIPQQRA